MAKRERSVAQRLEPGFTHLLTPENRVRLFEWVSARAPALIVGTKVPVRVRQKARQILHKSHGVLLSSTMALGTAILAMRESGDFGKDSLEVSLLQAVLRYSEQYQVPPMAVMQLIADEEEAVLEAAESGKPD